MSSFSTRHQNLLDILHKKWGYEDFRPLQIDIMDSLLDGHDTIGLMPTGGGKSLTFQVPGLYSDGMTLVITPLISLMKDQVDGLRRRRIRAVCLYSGMTSAEIRMAWEMLFNAKAKFLYCAPERLRNERFCQELRHLDVKHIVIDEAHCISQWGYDFRPDYLNISKLRKIFPDVPMLALTATATPVVVADIAEKTGMHDAKIFKKSFSRDNLSYIVRNVLDKRGEMMHILRCTNGSAIVYVRSRKRTKELARVLNECGISALPYHAGMESREKNEFQDRWAKGEVRVMVATNAFGMGIDKPDVRVVIHHDLPSSLEEYYQEAGRAGRDGLTSYAVLLCTNRDKSLLRRRVIEQFPARDEIKRVYELICTFLNVSVGEGYERMFEFEISTFCKLFKCEEKTVRASLSLLSLSGVMDMQEDVDMRSRVMLTVSREDLYHISGLSHQAELVLTKLLRLYTGLFSDFVYIDEVRVGRELSVDTRVIYESMLELSRARVLQYVPRRRVPYIYFPTSREETRYIQIPKVVYENRKVQAEQRIEAMIDYAFVGASCRVERVLEYFGEHNSGACGKCDVCRGTRPKGKYSVENVERFLLDRIKKSGSDGLGASEAVRVSGIDSEIIADGLRSLVLRGIIHMNCGRYVMSNDNKDCIAVIHDGTQKDVGTCRL
ncbi:MAG: RecQ family ATP-dependent DNA helicase [Prevotella sp.]|nr:RecQ family ATP-dependent DNA helicase [Bacteroides sp.]MCM1365691.1 RecQ family ATP-dependent DNA helicase [Prevotella sp.]MCM1437145.1 RecQ family ATP-dependent DNA helicase [Prevotella sp.]